MSVGARMVQHPQGCGSRLLCFDPMWATRPGTVIIVILFRIPFRIPWSRFEGCMRKLGIQVLFLCSLLQALPFAHAASVQPKVQFKAVPLPLSSVRLTGGPLKKAQDLDAAYLLELQPQRMLAFLRQRAGLDRRHKATAVGTAPAGSSPDTSRDTISPRSA